MSFIAPRALRLLACTFVAFVAFVVGHGLIACTDPSKPATPPAPPAATGPLAHLSDDYEEAKRLALAAGKILFVDAWAPWCHTCWSMKREVLDDASLGAYGDRVLMVELDTDKPGNAAFVARHPVKTWPTFFAIDPTNDTLLQSHGGSMSLPEVRAFLDRALALRSGAASEEDRALASGYAALQAKDAKVAADHFLGVKSGPRRTEAIFGAVRALRDAKDFARCASVAAEGLDVVAGSAAGGDLASYVVICSDELAKDDARRGPARAAAQKKLEALVASPAAGASVDDKADIMSNLAGLYDEAGRSADSRALHEQRVKLLEDDAASAASPTEARTHDYARMNSYLALGRGDDAVKLFQKRIEQFPDDYEAYARLASTLHKLKREDEALPVAVSAVRLSYGPRKLGYLKLLADIHAARGDVEGERAALRELIAANDALPEALRRPEAAHSAQARLAKPAASPAAPK
jgi:thioredoxin-like negative regulator of GroEL